MNDTIEICGVWIRSHGDKVQVLVEACPGEWVQIFCERMSDKESTTSHIVEPNGIRASPEVDAKGDFNPVPDSHAI